MKEKSVCEEESFLLIHQEHVAPLRNFLYYRFGSLEKAKDCAQEAFIRLWENCSKVTFDKARSFLFTVANRLFLDDASHQKVVLKFEKREATTDARQETNPEFLYRGQEFKEELEAAVSSLSEKQRAVFLLSRIDKLTNKEIAEALEISVKTVEKHISTSLKFLKTNLDELNHYKI